jgi:Spy/CpxP family protein refolding chaperone
MNLQKQHVLGLTGAALFLAAGSLVTAQEQRPFSPALEQLRETVAERLHSVADKLALSPEQRTKIKESHAAFAEKFEALRKDRRELLQSELEAMRDILTPEQRDMAKGFVEDMREQARSGAERDWPEVCSLRDALAERVQAASEKLALTPEQTKKLRDVHASFADKYRANRAERRELIEAQFKAIGAELTPEQREKARTFVEGRMAHAPIVQSVAERLRTAAEKLGLTEEQRKKIRETHATFRDKYHALRDERRALLMSELKAIGEQLTSDQRERIQDLCEDRVVVIGITFDPSDPDAIGQLRETIADRLNAAADKLGLTQEQRGKIREIHSTFAEKYEAQRAQRRNLRREELKALGEVLTPEQLEKVNSYVEDRVEALKSR